MTLRLRSLALALLLPLGAAELLSCVPPAADYTESDWPKDLRLDPAPARLAVGFVPGSSRMRSGDLARLRLVAASGGLVSSDRVVVAVAGPPALQRARFQALATALLPYGIVPTLAPPAPAAPNEAVIRRERYVVALPDCPNWSKPAAGAGDFTNTASSNFGCADTVNLGLIVAQPADLIEPRQLGFTDARPAVEAVNNYRRGKVQLPTAANIGPIAAPTSPAMPGAGAGGSGLGGFGAGGGEQP